MPDISMCPGDECFIKERCYRYTAEPNEYHQSFFVNAPLKEDGSCDYLMFKSRGPSIFTGEKVVSEDIREELTRRINGK